MDPNGLDPISGWYITDKATYFVVVFIASLMLRLISSLLKAIHTEGFSKNVRREFWIQVKGDRRVKFEGNVEDDEIKKREHIPDGDLWFPTIIGLIELSCFPVLMVTRN